MIEVFFRERNNSTVKHFETKQEMNNKKQTKKFLNDIFNNVEMKCEMNVFWKFSLQKRMVKIVSQTIIVSVISSRHHLEFFFSLEAREGAELACFFLLIVPE